MLRQLIGVANRLDSLGLTQEADSLDTIIFKMAQSTSSNATYTIMGNYILDTLRKHNDYYTVTQDINYGNESFAQDMSFYIKLVPNDQMKSEASYQNLFKDLPDTFLSYPKFKEAIDQFFIVFVDQRSTEAAAAEMHDNGMMRIFVSGLDDKFNNKKVEGLVGEFLSDAFNIETIYHELAHYLNHIRSSTPSYSRSKGTGDKFAIDTPAYINNTEEIQARIIEVLSDPNIQYYTELTEAIENNNPRSYINFLLPKILYWGQYTPENQARIINRLYKDFLEKQEARKKRQANPTEPIEVL